MLHTPGSSQLIPIFTCSSVTKLTRSHLWVSDLISETFMQMKLWHIVAKRLPQVFIVTINEEEEKKKDENPCQELKVVGCNNLHLGTWLTQSHFHIVVNRQLLSVSSASEGWKGNILGQRAHSVNYLMCWPWTISSYSDRTTFAANFHRRKCARCTHRCFWATLLSSSKTY